MIEAVRPTKNPAYGRIGGQYRSGNTQRRRRRDTRAAIPPSARAPGAGVKVITTPFLRIELPTIAVRLLVRVNWNERPPLKVRPVTAPSAVQSGAVGLIGTFCVISERPPTVRSLTRSVA